MFTIKHYFREGLITLTLEYFKVNLSARNIFLETDTFHLMFKANDDDGLMLGYDDVERMEKLITRSLDASRSNSIPAVKRCQIGRAHV